MIMFKAMGFEDELMIMKMVGNDEPTMQALLPCFEECHTAKVFNEYQVKTNYFDDIVGTIGSSQTLIKH